jgi:hypothetical protein
METILADIDEIERHQEENDRERFLANMRVRDDILDERDGVEYEKEETEHDNP